MDTGLDRQTDRDASYHMPFELTWERRGVYRRYFGRSTIKERQRSLDLICGNAAFTDLRYAITDYLEVESFEVTPESNEETAALHIAPANMNPRIKIAAVVVDEEIIFWIQRFISLGFTALPYQIFSTVESARFWIARQ
ncbi:MAG: hypothetical protein KGN16_00315 [Burkholderiales bacterium]|nr:hypothetical protein [Burkholderiales bacterium]